MNEDIKDNLHDLYGAYHHHKQLYEYWRKHRNLKSQDEIQDRIDYILKNKVNQRNELETLYWVLGIENNYNVDD